MVQMVREGTETGYLPNSSDFMKEFEVSRRTVARDLDFLRDEERAPLTYDDARHGFRLTDETYTLPAVRISRKEAFSFGLARKLLAHYEGTPLSSRSAQPFSRNTRSTRTGWAARVLSSLRTPPARTGSMKTRAARLRVGTGTAQQWMGTEPSGPWPRTASSPRPVPNPSSASPPTAPSGSGGTLRSRIRGWSGDGHTSYSLTRRGVRG